MHQPYYEDLATGEHVLPWVRMHGLKDYYGMAALLREFPKMKLTFNLVPSLLVQLEAFAEERARDWHLELGLKPAHELSDHERTVALAEFFHAPRGRMIDRYPRYAELLQKRESRRGIHEPGFSRPAGVAQAGVGRSVLPGRRRARAPAGRRSSAASAKPTKPSCARSSSRSFAGSFPSIATPPSGGRWSCRRRRSITRFCRCCATPTSISTRTRPPVCHARRSGIRTMRRSSSGAPGSVINGCLDATPTGCGRPKGRFRTTRPRSRRGPAFGGWRPTKRSSAAPLAAISAATRRGASRIPGRCTGPTPCRPAARTRSRACSATTRCRT